MRALLSAALPRVVGLTLALLGACPGGSQGLGVEVRAHAAAGAPGGPPGAVVAHSSEARRGETLSGQVSVPGGLDRLSAVLLGPDGARVAGAAGFRLPPEAGPTARGERWAFLLGLPSTLQAGEHTLLVRGAVGAGGFVHRVEVRVLAREFRSESIAFDGALSSLMTTPDPRRDREAAELAQVLATFRDTAVFHTAVLCMPLEGVRRTSFFADRRVYRYVDGGSSSSLHNGVDLAAPAGTPVKAAGSGRVVLARSRLMSGLSVVLEHLPGVYTLYFHLRDIAVQEGERVAQGEPIGTVGQTGLATGPHLHWELRVSGVAVDPEPFVGRPLIDKTPDSGTLIGSDKR